ncbi:hypothetical protein COY05_00580 [Candidatus Peregrinibacteria bacterium CG_4_10_14_0_2_um_filter_38_24]|nr:MAG: hypothetical protein COY05_00580 [Candidatus Peregrinibacteria bacterium CG_4_10_14_0_2_um_filter_38_24]
MKKILKYIFVLAILLVIGFCYGYYKYTEKNYTETEKIPYTNGVLFSEGQYKVKETLFGKEKMEIGLWRTTYPNGTIKKQVEYDENGDTISGKIYFLNGILESSYLNKDGLEFFIEYSEDGKLESETTRTEEGDGEDSYMKEEKKVYYKNGQIKSFERFIDGETDGTYIEWYENGQQKIEKEYNEGSLDGAYKVWDEKGAVLLSIEFKNDVFIK